MEFNRAQALKAKEMAEQYYKARNYKIAKLCCEKAQQLFPDLEGLKKLHVIVNVFCAYAHKINGVADYYGILGVHPSADQKTIRKQYLKLLLYIHPDKNDMDGASEAFLNFSEAWEVLENETTRKEYNTRINLIASDSNLDFTTHAPFVPSQPTSFHNFNFTTPHAPSFPSHPSSSSYDPRNMMFRDHFQYQWAPPAASPSQQPLHTSGTSSTHVPPASQTPTRNPEPKRKAPAAPSRSRPKSKLGIVGTFWTGCDRCRIKYAFQRILLNEHIQCPHCLATFLATEMSPPPTVNVKQPAVGHTNKAPSVAPDKVSPEHAKMRRNKDGQRCFDEKESQSTAGPSRDEEEEDGDEGVDLTLHL